MTPNCFSAHFPQHNNVTLRNQWSVHWLKSFFLCYSITESLPFNISTNKILKQNVIETYLPNNYGINVSKRTASDLTVVKTVWYWVTRHRELQRMREREQNVRQVDSVVCPQVSSASFLTQVSVSSGSFLVSVIANTQGRVGAFKGSAPLPLKHFLLLLSQSHRKLTLAFTQPKTSSIQVARMN